MNQLGFLDFELFDRIAATRSLSEVARERGVASSNISRALARIEAACGLRLARRSTQGLSLTDEGEIFLEHAQRMLSERRALQASMDPRLTAVTGSVRLALSRLLAEYVVIPSLPALTALHPELQLELQLSDRPTRIAEEGIDIAIRSGLPAGDHQVARQLCSYGRRLYAAPEYLRRHAEPAVPGDLASHVLISNAAVAGHNFWQFLPQSGGPMPVRGQVRADCSAAVAAMVLAGVGIASLNDRVGEALVLQGRLSPVLVAHGVPGRYAIEAVVLAERHRAPRIRAVIAHLQDVFSAAT